MQIGPTVAGVKTRSDTNLTEGPQRPDPHPSTGPETVTWAGGHRRGQSVPPGRRSPPPAPAPSLRPPARYEPYLDGLFTYCLSVLCDHDAATAALADVLAMAEANSSRLRDRRLTHAWLYALARHACLRGLSARESASGAEPPARTVPGHAVPDQTAARRRRELAALAWPEAAGTAPDQREALELAVRHGLQAEEVGAVLGLEAGQARALLSRAACEVERTRAALAVVETGSCPALARLAGDTHVLLGTALRRELVRHVDECAECRAAAERAMASGPWPGTRTPAVLAVIQAPGAAALAAVTATGAGAGAGGGPGDGPSGRSRARSQAHRAPAPRFDRRGFPMDTRDRAARRARLRHRAVTTTVVAAVVAAPVLALWAAYRGGQESTAHDVPVSAAEGDLKDGRLVNGQSPGGGAADRHRQGDGRAPGVSSDGAGRSDASGTPSPADGGSGASDTSSSSPSASGPGPSRPGQPSPGRLTLDAQPQGEDTVITLTASGGSPVSWSASTQSPWLVLSRTSGVLQPGESTTVTVAVDHDREPEGPWSGRVTFAPSGTSVTISGSGPAPSPSPPPSDSPSASTRSSSAPAPG